MSHRARVSHLFGKEVPPHHDLVVHRDPSVSWDHRIQPGDHRTQLTVRETGHLGSRTCQKGTHTQPSKRLRTTEDVFITEIEASQYWFVN